MYVSGLTIMITIKHAGDAVDDGGDGDNGDNDSEGKAKESYWRDYVKRARYLMLCVRALGSL